MTAVSPFGRWPSPLDAAQVASGRVSLSEVCSDGTRLYWLESRPEEGGRVVLVGVGDGEGDGDDDGAGDGAGGVTDLSPPGTSIRSRVHEYGGGAVCLLPGRGGAFAYVDQNDQRVWMVEGTGASPVALSGEPATGERWNHGGLSASADGTWVVAVREMHHPGWDRPRRCVVALGARADTTGETVLLEGHDFYGAPRLNAPADRVAVVVWDHPDMPWDRSALTVIRLEAESASGMEDAGRRRLVPVGEPWTVDDAGGGAVSVGQPMWRSDGGLRFISDRHGWWQPFVHSGDDDDEPAVRLADTEAEFHGPDWALRQTTMVELADGTVVARMTAAGRDSLVALVEPGQPPRLLSQPCLSISAVCAHGDGLAYIGAPADGPAGVWVLRSPLATSSAVPPVSAVPARPRPALALGPTDIAAGEPFSATGRSGRPVHGVLYPPTLGGTGGPPGEPPPLVVACHGGPTGASVAGFDYLVQYFTSHGLAVASVDYAGSTGYGRAYRCALWGQWGVADAEDCVDAAQALAAQGRVDATRMAVRGTSAGGLTALNALASGQGFAAAVAWYGVTDLLGLAASSHDFESHYTERLVGPLPECRPEYEARSPVHRAGEIQGAVLLLQGTEDVIVPPAQTEGLQRALQSRGRYCEVRYFEGEGHGFRSAGTLRAALEAELDFYRRQLRL
jgi:dienelactone hydrolase